MNNEQEQKIEPLSEQEEGQLLELWGSNESVFAMQIQRLFASLHNERTERQRVEVKLGELWGKVAAMQSIDGSIIKYEQAKSVALEKEVHELRQVYLTTREALAKSSSETERQLRVELEELRGKVAMLRQYILEFAETMHGFIVQHSGTFMDCPEPECVEAKQAIAAQPPQSGGEGG